MKSSIPTLDMLFLATIWTLDVALHSHIGFMGAKEHRMPLRPGSEGLPIIVNIWDILVGTH